MEVPMLKLNLKNLSDIFFLAGQLQPYMPAKYFGPMINYLGLGVALDTVRRSCALSGACTVRITVTKMKWLRPCDSEYNCN